MALFSDMTFQSRNRAGRNVESARNLAHWLASIALLNRLALPVRGKFWLSPQLHAARLGAFPAFACADQFALQCYQAAQHCQHQAPVCTPNHEVILQRICATEKHLKFNGFILNNSLFRHLKKSKEAEQV
jgi:hypothetical protein